MKERLQTASPEEKEEIRKQLEAIETQKAAELEKKRAAAEKREAERIAKEQEALIASKESEAVKEPEASKVTYTPSDITSIKVEGPPKYYVGQSTILFTIMFGVIQLLSLSLFLSLIPTYTMYSRHSWRSVRSRSRSYETACSHTEGSTGH